MPLDENQRREYLEQAGVTDEQIEQAVGPVRVSEVTARATRHTAADVREAEAGVRQLIADVTIISAKYDEISRRTKQDAREVADSNELARDRALLEEMIGDEYRLMNPFGKAEGKEETINKILSGTIRPDTFGRGGFASSEHELQLHGAERPNTAISVGTFTMRGSGLAQFPTGAVRWRNLSGTYRTTHTFSFREDRWQITASHLTQVPAKSDFVFVGERGGG
jgi:hypothetical protein